MRRRSGADQPAHCAGGDAGGDGPDGYTPRARRVLERAAQEAQALSSAQMARASAAGHPEGTGTAWRPDC